MSNINKSTGCTRICFQPALKRMVRAFQVGQVIVVVALQLQLKQIPENIHAIPQYGKKFLFTHTKVYMYVCVYAKVSVISQSDLFLRRHVKFQFGP